MTRDVCYGTFWEALKAFIKGHIVSYMAHMKRQADQQNSDISNHISQLQAACAATPSPNLLKELSVEKDKLNIILSF